MENEQRIVLAKAYGSKKLLCYFEVSEIFDFAAIVFNKFGLRKEESQLWWGERVAPYWPSFF